MSFTRGHSSAIWTKLFYVLAVCALLLCLQNAVVSASPTRLIARQDSDQEWLPDDPDYTDDVGSSGSPFDDPAPQEDKYPGIDECRDKCSVAADKSLFYSQVGKFEDKPSDFAKKEGLTLVRDAYPAGFTDKRKDSTKYVKFAERFSTAFAEKTSGTAWVLLPTDSTDISKRVWAGIEKPILTAANGACNRIIKVDPDDFSKRCILWDRGDKYDDDKMSRCGLENGPVPPPPSGAGATFEPGRCRVHVTQYQKNEANNPSSVYRLDVTLYDNANKVAGERFGFDAPTNEYEGVTSLLPNVLLVAAGEVDDSAVLFKYGAQSWGSNDQPHECNFGGYEDGNRDGDCKFDC